MERTMTVVTTCLAAGLVMLSGCVVADSRKSYSGRFVSKDMRGKIVPGKTTKAELIAMLGLPTRESETAAGNQVLVYEGTETAENDFDVSFVLPVIDAHEKIRTRRTTFFEIVDGIVTGHWTESSKHKDASTLRVL